MDQSRSVWCLRKTRSGECSGGSEAPGKFAAAEFKARVATESCTNIIRSMVERLSGRVSCTRGSQRIDSQHVQR
jgi:hypothetical protein